MTSQLKSNYFSFCTTLDQNEAMKALRFVENLNISGAQIRSELEFPKGLHDFSGPAQSTLGRELGRVTCRKCALSPQSLTLHNLVCPH